MGIIFSDEISLVAVGGDGHCRSESEGLSGSASERAANRFGRLRGLGRFFRGGTLVVIDEDIGNVGCRLITGEETRLCCGKFETRGGEIGLGILWSLADVDGVGNGWDK